MTTPPPPRRAPATAIALGLAGVSLVLLVLLPFNDRLDLSVPALLLLVPIAGTSVIGGWKSATCVAFGAAVGYSFGYVPPIGDIRPHLGRDVFTLVTFVTVALIVGVLAHRDPPQPRAEVTELLDQRRVELLRTVGHDLRNPLHTIQAVTTGLISSADDDEARASLAKVAAESRRLDRIVANMLHVSRIQAGALVPALAPEYPPALLRSTIERVRPAITQRIDVEPPEPTFDLLVDAVQFDQVLTNLLENAARHGKPDGVITVTVADHGRFAEISVRDDGPGFTALELETPGLFEPGDASHGVGLGLAVCRGIIEAHGGRLRLSNPPGGGAEVRFTVPTISTAR